MWVALYKLNMIIFVDSDSEYFISLLAFNNNGDGEATASSVRTAPLGKTALTWQGWWRHLVQLSRCNCDHLVIEMLDILELSVSVASAYRRYILGSLTRFTEMPSE